MENLETIIVNDGDKDFISPEKLPEYPKNKQKLPNN